MSEGTVIVIKVELHSAITGNTTELGRMIIANDGEQGNGSLGDYVVKLGRKGQSDVQIWKKPQREGAVKGHRRLALSVWNLVAKALHSVGHGAEVTSQETFEPEGLSLKDLDRIAKEVQEKK